MPRLLAAGVMQTAVLPKPVIGDSRALRRALDLCQRVAPTCATVLITGETGTGKELLAELIHRNGPRRDKPIVVFNCQGVPETLLESELFGHERGAFTGAVRARCGVFERSNGTTLLIDEVGDVPLAAQAKLLRVLQERRSTRLGGTAPHTVDVRVIATTQHDLRSRAQHGQFREDLFYRLNVFPIHVPPLRERREDIRPLAAFLLETIARQNRGRQSGFTDEALALLIGHRWRGNARELRAVIERALLMSGGAPVTAEHLPPDLAGGFMPPGPGESATSLAYSQRLLVARALFESGWNLAQAAIQLGVSTHVLRQMIARFGLTRSGM